MGLKEQAHPCRVLSIAFPLFNLVPSMRIAVITIVGDPDVIQRPLLRRLTHATSFARSPRLPSLRYRQLRKCTMCRYRSRPDISECCRPSRCHRLVECENGKEEWVNITGNCTRVSIPASLRRAVFDSLYC